MSDDDGITQDEQTLCAGLAKHRLLVLIGLVIGITVVFTSVGLYLYTSNGSAQLDLSRPGFKGVDKTVENNRPATVDYSASGDINESTLKEFQELYQTQMKSVRSVNAFGGDPMAPDALGID